MRKSMMKKSVSILLAAGIMSAAFAGSAFAGSWAQDANGWRYSFDNGSSPASCWQWIDGNNDGNAESYCFNQDGYLYTGTTTPDGYTVNADGQWTQDGTLMQLVMDPAVFARSGMRLNGDLFKGFRYDQDKNGWNCYYSVNDPSVFVLASAAKNLNLSTDDLKARAKGNVQSSVGTLANAEPFYDYEKNGTVWSGVSGTDSQGNFVTLLYGVNGNSFYGLESIAADASYNANVLMDAFSAE